MTTECAPPVDLADSNRGLAARCYKHECKTTNPSSPLNTNRSAVTTLPIVVEGWWIWWCETHQQPLPWCDKARLKNAQAGLVATIESIKMLPNVEKAMGESGRAYNLAIQDAITIVKKELGL